MYVLDSFDIVNTFPSNDEKFGLQAVKNALKATGKQFPPNLCVIETLKALMSKM